MTRDAGVIENRDVCDFDRVVLCVHNLMNQMEIVQGEQESLTVEARPEVLAKIETTVRGRELTIGLGGSLLDKLGFALTTSLTRPVVRYRLTVKRLTHLELVGLANANATELCAGSLSLRLQGAGGITVGSLMAQRVVTELRGTGRIELSGQVDEQEAAIQGPGIYEALNLKSRKACVRLEGLGRARVWVTDELEVKVRGLGRVEVRGTPRIRQEISPRVPQPRVGPPSPGRAT